jgi:DNA-binding transcriptional regulator YiaG
MRNRDVLDLADAVRLAASGEGRAIRLRAKVSQAALSSAVGIEPSTVCRWEAASRVPTGQAAARWARLLRTLEADRVAAVPS